MKEVVFYSDNSSNKKYWQKKGLYFLTVLLLFIISYGAYFSWKVYAVSRKINVENVEDERKNSYINSVGTIFSTVISPKYEFLKGEKEGRINILLLGAAGENWPGKNLTDTIMLVSIDTKNKKVAFLSLPRDLYVPVISSDYSVKINQLYQLGLKNNNDFELIKKTVESITNLTIHYFLIVDFQGFKKVIDDIGGINIIVERDIYDPKYPGPNYSYETFEIKKGFHHMDGETALKYARMRHDDPEGDFGRAKRQQAIIQAAKNRIFSLGTFLNPIALNNLLNTLGSHIKTNITLSEIESFIALSKEVDTQNIINVVVDAWKKDSLLKGSQLSTSNGQVSILVPRAGNWSEVQDLAQNIFNLDILKKRQAEIEKEAAGVAVINQSGNSELTSKIYDLVQNKLKIKNTTVLHHAVKSARSDTILIDNTEKRKMFTLDELIKKIPAKLGDNYNDVVKNEDVKKYDIILILGQDLTEKYSFKEVSQEEFDKIQEKQE